MKLTAQDFLVQFGRRLVFKREVACDHGEEDDAAGPHIDARPVVLETVNHFWCCVAGRAASCLQHLARLVGVAEAEVDQTNVFLVVEQQVFWFEVAVHDAEFMEVLHAADDLLKKLAGLRLLQLLLFHDVVKELAARDELHDEEELFGCLDDLKELDNVRVSDQLEDVDFSGHTLHVGIARDFALFQNFDGHLHTNTSVRKTRDFESLLLRKFKLNAEAASAAHLPFLL